MNYQTTIVNNWPDVEKLKSDWARLQELSEYNSVFQMYGWHQAWWESYKNKYKPYIIVVSKDDIIIGIGAFIRDIKNNIQFLGSPETEYQNFIYDPKYPEVIDLILEKLIQDNKSSKIKLWEIPAVSFLAHKINEKLNKSKLAYSIYKHASFQAQLSHKINKKDVKYRGNKLKKLGQVTYCSNIKTLEEKLKLLDLYFTWLDERFGNSLSRYRKLQLSNEYKNFCKNLITNFQGKNDGPSVNMLCLKLDGEPIAMDKVIHHGDTIYGLMQTYNPKYIYFSPGSILLQNSINSWVENGIKVNDFLRGDEDYKMRFVNSSIQLNRYTIYPSYLRKIINQYIDKIIQLIKPTVFKLFDYILFFKKLSPSSLFKIVIFASLWYSGLAYLYQLLSKHRSRVLNYHSIAYHPKASSVLNVKPNVFALQMQYVRKIKDLGYDVDITFDDGYENNYQNALPIMEKLNLKGTIFPTIDFIERGYVESWKGEKQLSALNWQQIKEVSDSGKMSIGSHTLSHKDLGQLDQSQLENELGKSKEILSQQLGKEITAVAYPFGKKQNYNSEVIKIAKDLGYKKGYTIEEGTNSNKTDPFKLKRLVIFDESMFMFKVRVSGIIDDLLNIFR